MSIFDVMGPIMIGPSSSHTAGAAKIGKMARLIFNEKIDEANIYFHGSFADTYKGHGTDRAIVGGILGFNLDDERIKNSLEIAREKNIKVTFDRIDLKDAHPNSVMIKLKGESKEFSLVGSSIGGGDILVNKIDTYEVNISGKLPTLWILHQDRPGEVGIITSILGSYKLNIAYMQVFRKKKGTIGSSIIELDHDVNQFIIKHLENMDDIVQVRYIPPM